MTTRTIREVFRNDDGTEYEAYFPLFANDASALGYPLWITNDVELQQRIDIQFFGVKARDRVVSPFVDHTASEYSTRDIIVPGELGFWQLVIIHRALSKFSDKWDKIRSALLAEYNPLENYSMQETETPNITKTGTTNLTKTGSTDTTKTGSTNNSANSAANVYGFNSSSAVPQGSSSGSGTGSSSETDRGTTTETDTGSHTETERGTRNRTRSGNIGVTTSQQMLQAELEVRKNILVNIMCDDIASVLCSPVWRVES